MKTITAIIAILGVTSMLAGCLEIDLSRVNGNQKDDAADVETTE